MKESRCGDHGNVTNIVAVIGGNGATATGPSVVTVLLLQLHPMR